jgi:hypothetical protein
MLLQIEAFCQQNGWDPLLVAWYHTCSTMQIKGKSNCLDAVCTGMFVLIPLSKKGPTQLFKTTLLYDFFL